MKKFLFLVLFNLFSSQVVLAGSSYVTYKVKKGDTLYKIASAYKTSVSEIQKASGLKTTALSINKTLKIPSKVISASTPYVSSLPNINAASKISYPVSGSADPKSTVYLTFKDSSNRSISYHTPADSKGKFSLRANLSSLKDGNIVLSYYQKTTKATSSVGQKIVKKDTVLPNIQLNAGSVSVLNANKYMISGKSETNSVVNIFVMDSKKKQLAKIVKANSNGIFSLLLDVRSLIDGKLSVKAEVKDAFGNPRSTVILVNKMTKVTPPVQPPVVIPPVDPPTQPVDPTIYNLSSNEMSKWSIYNDNTHPVETTKGLNDALIWAQSNGYTTFKVPAGTYLIAKNAQINMVSNMTFLLDDQAVIQKESNDLIGYTTLNIGTGVHDVTLKGGTYLGEKDTHDYKNGAVLWEPNHAYKKGDKVVPPNTVDDNYSYYYVAANDGISGSVEPPWLWTKTSNDNTVVWQPNPKNTNEGGYGIVMSGAKNVTVDGITAKNFTGDGLAIGGANLYFQDYYQNNFESGSIDDSGNLVADSNRVRINKLINLNDPRFATTRTFTFGHQQYLGGSFSVYFYKVDGSFLSSVKNQYYRKFVAIPDGAVSMRATFSTSNLTGDYVELWSIAPSKNVVVQNSEFAFNRRQGITIGQGDGILIIHNKLHDQKGTAPESGIDLEGGDFVLNNHITIKENEFYNNNRYDVILYDGTNTIVEGNTLGSKGKIGLAVSTPFNGATIKDNVFDGSQIYAYHDVSFIGNRMIGGLTHLEGPNLMIDGMQFENSTFAVSPIVPYGVGITNVNLINTSFGINVNPVHVSNMTLNGGGIDGSVAGSTFDHLNVLNSSGTNLSLGSYTNCVFETVVSNNGPHSGREGVYTFDNCTFKGAGPGLNGKNMDVTIKNSKFEQAGFTIATAKNVDLENNVFNMNLTHNDLFKPSVIMIGGYWTRTSPYGVQKAVIKENVIQSNDNAGGISTVFAGIGSRIVAMSFCEPRS